MKLTIKLIILMSGLWFSFMVHAKTYSYDELNRLKTVTYDSGQIVTYNYDAAGNILSTDSQVPLVGDLDNDSDIDRNDLNIILAARNTPSDGPDDPRDLDNDGMITGLDARKLTQLCTRPRCANE